MHLFIVPHLVIDEMKRRQDMSKQTLKNQMSLQTQNLRVLLLPRRPAVRHQRARGRPPSRNNNSAMETLDLSHPATAPPDVVAERGCIERKPKINPCTFAIHRTPPRPHAATRKTRCTATGSLGKKGCEPKEIFNS